MINASEDFESLTEKEKLAMLDDAILNSKELSGNTWSCYYRYGYIDEIDNICDMAEAGRWNVPETIIFEYKNKFYSIWFYRGLTECQEDEWEEQTAEEVCKVARTIYVWESVK